MSKKGLIIINLGSPESYSVKDVKIYLREFLMDEKVIDVPPIIRSILVKGFIIPFRAKNSAEAYKTVWTEKGSPLKVITQEFSELVQKQLDMPVSVAMRYGKPTPADALAELEKKAGGPLDEILLAPMYPHYAMSSTETAVDHVRDYIVANRKNVKLRILKPFYNEPGYIDSLADSIRPYLNEQKFDAYLFSYHGLPIRHLKKADTTGKHCYMSGECCELKSVAWETCYKHQVKETTRLVTEKLQLEEEKVVLTFQSRLEGDKWVQPYTDFTTSDGSNWNNHVELGLWADAMVIAPTSANTLAKMATGNCDNMLLATYLSAKCPVFFAPAMDLDMWKHKAVKRNIEYLHSYGNILIPVEHGELASGLVGDGRMAEPEHIVDHLEEYFQ